MRDVGIGSITITILSVVPVVMVMTTLNTVVMYQSINTLTLIVTILLIALVFEILITWSRRMLLVILATRLDTRMNFAIFHMPYVAAHGLLRAQSGRGTR